MVEGFMAIAIQTAGCRLNHRPPNRGAIDADGFLCPDYIIDYVKSGITHGDAEPCGDAEKTPILRSLVPDVDQMLLAHGSRGIALNTATRSLMYSATEGSLPSSEELVP
jgi:hypothetical protein